MKRKGLLPKGLYYCLFPLMLIFYIWYSGIWDFFANGLAKERSKIPTISLNDMNARVRAIKRNADHDRAYTVKNYARDLFKIRRPERDHDQTYPRYRYEPTIYFLKAKAEIHSFNQAIPTRSDEPASFTKVRKQYRFERELTRAQEPFLVKERAECRKNWPSLGEFLLGWIRLYLVFVPITMIILFARIMTCYRRIEEIIACVYWDWPRLLGASFAGVFGLEFYKPELVVRILDDRARDIHHEKSNWWVYGGTNWNEEVWREVIEPGIAFVNFFKITWLTDWQQLLPKPWKREWRYRVYLTYVALVCIMVGESNLVFGAEDSKDKQLIHPQSLFFGIKKPEGKSPLFTTAMLFKEGEFWIFGINRQNTYETNPYLVHWKKGRSTIEAGPTFDFARDKVVACGGYAFVNFQLDKYWKLAGPYYFNKATGGNWSFSTLNLMLSRPIGKDFRVGLGSEFKFENGKKPKILAGPWFQAKVKDLTVRLRFGEWFAGPDKGKNQAIAHFIYAF